MMNGKCKIMIAALACLCWAGNVRAVEPIPERILFSFDAQAEAERWKMFTHEYFPGRQNAPIRSDGGLLIDALGGGEAAVSTGVNLVEWRDFEYLEFDIRALTVVDEVKMMLWTPELQGFIAIWDLLQPGEVVHVKLRLVDFEHVRFGTGSNMIFTVNNPTETPQQVILDHFVLTGYGREKLRVRTALDNFTAVAGKADDALQLEVWEFLRRDGSQKDTADILIAKLSQAMKKVLAEKNPGGLLAAVKSPLEKYNRGSALATIGAKTGAIELTAAGNEYENAQLLLHNIGAGDIAGLTAEFNGGADFPGKVTFHIVDDINNGGALQYPGKLMNDIVADPLLPLTPFAVMPDETRSLWLNVYVPSDSKAGKYSGTLTVKNDVVALDVPVTLTVRNFTLPERCSLQTQLGLWSYDWVNFYEYAKYPKDQMLYNSTFDDVPLEAKLRMTEKCREYRFNPSGMFTCLISEDGQEPKKPDDVKRIWQEILQTQNYVIVGMMSGYTYDPVGKSYSDSDKKIYHDKFAAMLSDAPDTGELLVYLLDEPFRQENRGGWETACVEGELIKSIDPRFKTICATGVMLPPLDGGYENIDICATLWDRTPIRKAQQQQRDSATREVWWYGCNVVYSPYPNWTYQFDGMSTRIIPLMTYKFKMQGVLQWSVNLWGGYNADPDRSERWPDIPWNCAEWYFQPGEAHLFYPGRDGEMWPSIRLENWRDGAEDYEYIMLLEKALPKLSEADRAAARKLLEMNDLVQAPYQFERQAEPVSAWRDQVAEYIEKGI